jgi:hypothetical protein
MKIAKNTKLQKKGFTLIITMSMMILLALIAIGLLNLSSTSIRASSLSKSTAEARANARMAMFIALGELQKEMGPDMRVSAKASLQDTDRETPKIDGVAQPNWLSTYDSWGSWLNGQYARPGGARMRIQDTYGPNRSSMFRRWLVSMPPNMMNDVRSAVVPGNLDNNNSAIMVGRGSVGLAADLDPSLITRAYLMPIGNTGRHAWWISPENQKAKVDLANKERNLSNEAWQVSQGNTARVGISAMQGLNSMDGDPAIGDKFISTQTLRHANVDKDSLDSRFFDLTAHSQGVISSVRSGHLKKDLSLLFEQSNANLPVPYRFNTGVVQEPSIRPISQDISSKQAVIPNRHFQSWTNMRHYYRMYRSRSDATPTLQQVNGALRWTGSKPFTDFASSTALTNPGPAFNGSNHYWRSPVLAKLTIVYSLVTRPAADGKFQCIQCYNPIFTFWNPYNVELRIPSGTMTMSSKAYTLWPTNSRFHTNGTFRASNGLTEARNFNGVIKSASGSGEIVFQPGELQVFSLKTSFNSGTASASVTADLTPGFDPDVVVGDERGWQFTENTGGGNKTIATFSQGDNPGVAYQFSSAQWGGGVNVGNTPGAMCLNSNLTGGEGGLPMTYSNDWFQRRALSDPNDQTFTPITPLGASNLATWTFDNQPKIVAYAQMAIKGLFNYEYPSIAWEQDWRSRNWIQAPPFYFGSGMHMSLDNRIAQTQRLDCPYIVNFGPAQSASITKLVGQIGGRSFFGVGDVSGEKVTSVAALELPSAPISSLAGFANMRINPGWSDANQLGSGLSAGRFTGNGYNSEAASMFSSESKRVAYQSGVTGPGIGNSFMHPVLPRTDIYQFLNNSVSQDLINRGTPGVHQANNTNAFCDHWDHVFLLNDTLWDDYYVSSLANQERSGARTDTYSLNVNIDRLLAGTGIANSRYRLLETGIPDSQVKTDLQSAQGFLKAANYLMVDGMFNVNSTSVDAWQALFTGIRERQIVFRNSSGGLQKVAIPSGQRIAVSRFDTEVSDQEMSDPRVGVRMPDGSMGWSSVRFLDDTQLRRLSEECVKQVKLRGPFLNFSEFINRRLSNDNLGTMGALQSAIDFDDNNPSPQSINYRYKVSPDLMITTSQLGNNSYATPEAASGSRLAGIPGYVVQSDLLKPIANTLNVRDDTFSIRAYGEALDANGNVLARAWCEAVVQRIPNYVDPSNAADVSATILSTAGVFSNNSNLIATNQRFGRQFQMKNFRWLSANEI